MSDGIDHHNIINQIINGRSKWSAEITDVEIDELKAGNFIVSKPNNNFLVDYPKEFTHSVNRLGYTM